ncbi:MAG TPA: outer membrane beta-barrel protein [Pseudolabrys sp.]
MRRLSIAVLASVSTVAFTQITSAADLPTKMAVKAPMASGIPWTGFYVDGGLGYGTWAADSTVNAPGTGNCVICETQVEGGKGWLATVGAGYDYQFSAKIVAGVFGDASVSSLKGTLQDQNTFSNGEIKQTSSWAAGGRVGWLVTPQTLSYVNGGYASARFSDTTMVSAFTGLPRGLTTPEVTTNGWFLGGGVETSVAPNWFWRTEYRYAYYSNKVISESPTTFDVNFKPLVQTVTSKIVYKFNGGMAPVYPAAPVMATNWTGLYANAGVGYGVWNANVTDGVTGAPCSICVAQVAGGKGYLGVIGAGYDWQFAPAWVAGLFGDFDVSSLKGTLPDQNALFSGSIKETSAWAGGARLGWLPSSQTMTYMNGGYTGARFSGTNMVLMTTGASVAFSTPATNFSGWFVGGGVETTFDFFGMLGKGWFWRNEYRYASYGNKTITNSSGGVPVFDIAFRPTVQTVTSQVVFKFN